MDTPAVMMGYGLDDDRIHSAIERAGSRVPYQVLMFLCLFSNGDYGMCSLFSLC
jgi:hypothetical protein